MQGKFGTDSEKPSSTSIAQDLPWTTIKPKSGQNEEYQVAAKVKKASSKKSNEIYPHNLPVHIPTDS